MEKLLDPARAIQKRSAPIEQIQTYLAELEKLFAEMDAAYQLAADRLGFACRGCETNCCRSLFYHHTLAEWLFLKSGLARLPAGDLDRIRRLAGQINALPDNPGPGLDHSGPRPMCPLNRHGRCALYTRRPMICRLHGIPHELRGPSGRRRIAPGCDEFTRQTRGREVREGLLDRTPWYMALALLEKRLRSSLGWERKLKLTIAEMILFDGPSELESR